MSFGRSGATSGVRSKLHLFLFMFLSVGALGRARAAVTLVQHTGKDAGTTTSSTLAFTANNTAGNFIAVAVRAGNVGQSITVTDTRGNTYRRAIQANAILDGVTLAVYYAEAIAAGANTVTVSDTLSGGTLRFAIFEYAGVATSSSLDGTPVSAEGTGTALSSGTTTTTAGGDLVLGVFSSSDPATFTAGSGATIQERVPVAPNAKLAVQDQFPSGIGPVAATATISPSQAWAAAVAAFKAAGAAPAVPDLTIAKSHAGSFTQGQTGAAYTITVSNVGTGPASGSVTVTDTLPAGLTATAFSGTGWSCTLSPLSCTRSDALAVSASYPAITLTVNVSASAGSPLTNAASVSGGGETNTANDVANDATTINPSGGAGPITLVQHTSKDAGTTTSSTLAFSANNTQGNFILVAIRAGNAGQSFTVTDTRGNTYRRALQQSETLDTVTVGLYYAENIAAGANSVTVADTVAGGSLRFAILEYTGVATAGSLDGTPRMSEGNTTAPSSGAITTTASGDLIVGLFSTSDAATFTQGANAVIQDRIPSTSSKLAVQDQIQTSAGSIAASASISPGQAWAAAVAAFRPAGSTPVPDLLIAKSHTGSFTQGQVGATYTLSVSNGGSASTSGTVTVTDTLPAGLTATGIAGTGWSCTLATLTCTRSDALAPAGAYPAITVTVNVSSSALPTVTNAASVSGGGQTNTGNDGATDPTTVTQTQASSIGQWSAVQNWPIVAVHANLLPTGDVLAWTDYTTSSGAQLWRRGTTTFVPKTYSPVSLFCAGHVWLSDGRLMVLGGIVGLSDDVGPRETTFFDPVTEAWADGPLMDQGRYYPTGTTLPDGRVLVAGGTNTCSTCYANELEIYDPAANLWTPMAASAWQAFKYYPHLYVLPNGKIFLAAQDDKAIASQVLDLTTQTWTTVDSRIIDGHSSAMYAPGKVMKCGKATADNQGLPSVNTSYWIDMTQTGAVWQAGGNMANPRSHHNLTILPDGQVLVTGGGRTTDKADFTTAVLPAEMWSPATKNWTTMASMQTPRLYHSTALLLPDATVLVAGGGRENGRSQPDPKDQPNAEIFSPPYLFKGARPVITSAPAVLSYGTGFTVVTPDAARIASVSMIPLGAVTHAYNQTQRFVPVTFTAGSGQLTVNAPADGNTAPPGNYMLFLVDNQGIPSVAAMVRLPAAGNDAQPPSAPATLTAPVSGGSVNLSWSASIDNVGVTGYNVHRSTTSGFTPSTGNRIAQPSGTAYTDTPPGPGAYYYKVTAQDARGNVSSPSPQASATIVASVPDLAISKSHAGTFTQGQTGATYTITVSNVGSGPTSGTVTVTDTLPTGLTATALAGTGWTCTVATRTCTRADALAASSSYPAITLTVSVSASAGSPLTNSAAVSGGGETNTANDTATDPTTIIPSGAGPVPIVLVQHVGKDAGTGTSSTLAFTANNTQGNFILVAIRAGKNGQSFTVTDTRGNTYRQALQQNETLDTVTLGLYYAENVAGGANTVTVSDTVNGGTLRFAIFEYSGVATASSLDGSARMAEGTSTAASSGSITTTAAGDLVVGMFSTANNATFTAGSGAVVEERVPASGTKLAVQDHVQSAAGAIAASAASTPSQDWAAVVAAFKAAIGPAPNGPKLIITSPTEGGSVPGAALPVTYAWTGDLSEVNHVHFQLDSDPVVMDLSFDGVFQYNGLHVGPHTLNGVLVRSDHSPIAGSDAVPIHFTTVVDPSDPTPPSVQITSPTGGTVMGVVTILANAGDNVGVYGVQFKIDGVAAGAEDLVAPYGYDWNTAASLNGVHTLTAVARDAAGRETTSAPVTVTVANVSPTDPSVIGQFAGPYSWPLVSVHGILLPTGKVLLYDDHTTTAGVQVWDPVTGALTARPYNANNLFCSGHTLLPDGRVFVAGGHITAYVGIPDTTIFDPATETWTAGPDMSQARWYPTTTSLPDGRVLIVSGADNCPTCVDPNGTHAGIALIPEIYDPRTNSISQLPSASLSLPLYPHMHVLPDGRVLAVATQEDAIVSRALNIAASSWATMDPVARDAGSSVMYRPGKILKTGMGRNPDYAAVPSNASAWVMDTTAPSPTWRSIAPMNFARTQHNLVVLPDGNVFAVGGSVNSDVYDTPGCVKTAELWDATAETWTPLATMQEPRHYHSIGLLLPDGRVLVAGGGRFGPSFPSAEVYSPPYLFKGPRPAITSAPSTIQLNSHFGVGTPDGGRIAKVTLVRLGAPTHGFDENQRYLELPFATIPNGVDVTAPTSPNLAPPGHYMLFLVDTTGVPSVSAMVRIPAPWEDNVPPSAPSNLNGSTQTGRVDLTWTAATDNTGVALYNVHRGTSSGFTPTIANRVGQSATTSFRDTGFATGTWYYLVTAQDAAGNVGNPSGQFSIFAQADTTVPTVSLTGPAAGATLSGIANLSATASDDVGVVGVQFLVDGNAAGAEDTSSPYLVGWNSNSVTNGSHTLAARARDAAGNTTTTPTIPINVSNLGVPGLAAAYSFDDGGGTNVTDSSIYVNNGTLAGATFTTSGHTLGALSFTPNNNVTIPASPSLDIAGHALTIELWANITTPTTSDYVLVNKPWSPTSQSSPYYQYGIEYSLNNRTADFFFGDTGSQVRGPFSMAVPSGTWVHIAFTYDGVSVKGYLNGNLILTAAATADIQARGNLLRLGVDGSLNQGYRGLMDDLRIYNRTLTETEIQQDMAQPVVLP
jgi:uncharacterized repeat protein (TIGR01451 family)